MPNSADNSPRLDEESEVEQDDSSLSGMSDPELDELGLAMPEFRVPSKGGDDEQGATDDAEDASSTAQTQERAAAPRGRVESPAPTQEQGASSSATTQERAASPSAETQERTPPGVDSETGDEEGADSEAGETGDGSTLGFNPDNTANVAPEELEEELQEDARGAPASGVAQRNHGGDEAFDRAELVKTVRMDAFDRSAVEGGQSWEISEYLADQRYAPDVLVHPPRVLTRKWQDGAAVRPNGAPAASPTTPEDRRAFAETIRTTIPDGSFEDEIEKLESLDESGEIAVDSDGVELELDSEVLEDAEVRPPPQPAKDAQDGPIEGSAPAQAPNGEQSARQRPGRVRRNTGPLRPPQPTPVPVEEKADDDLSGIVQELLDEKKADEQKPDQKKPAKQRRPDDKRTGWFMDVFGEEYFRTLPPDLSKVTEREVRFMHQSLGLQKGARVLDLACGFGRHAVELARRDYEVAGLDISMAMLQRALSEAQRRNLSIKFIHGDMRELNFQEIFDACINWQTSFGYFDDRTNVQVAKGIARALKPGGRLLLDVVNRDYVISEMPSRTWWEGHECVFLEEVEFDNHTSILHTKRSFIYEDGSPPREFSSYIRLYSLHELRQLLAFAGFRLLEVSGEVFHRGSFLGPSSPRLILLAERHKRESG